MAEMKVEIKGDNIVLTVPINKNMPLSKSGKSRQVFTSGGNQATTLDVINSHKATDCSVIVGMNLYVTATDDEAVERQTTVAAAAETAKNA